MPAVDLDSPRATPWLEHEPLSAPTTASGIPGVNGITVAGGHVLLTSTARALVMRVPVTATDSAALDLVAERLLAVTSGASHKPMPAIRPARGPRIGWRSA